MKRVRCPKCDHYITFDETQYQDGQRLIFQCPDCGKQFGIRMGVTQLRNRQKDENPDENANEKGFGSIIVGNNVIGRYQKGNPINTPIETVDPSVDLNHCTINAKHDKHGNICYTLSDNNSNTGTFVDNVEIKPNERRRIEDGTLFTIGATSIILRGANNEEE